MVTMKKTQRKLCIRYMRRQRAACLSVFVVAMLAVMAYLGIIDTAQAMKNNIGRFWKDTAFRDIEISTSKLLSGENLEAIRQTEGVAAVEPLWYTTARSDSGNATGFDVISLTEQINTVILKEGRMPETAEECLLELPVLEELGISVGDTIEVGETDALAIRRFLVCGIAQHAEHACLPIQVPGNRYMIVRKEAFDLGAIDNRCMKAILRVEGSEGCDRFSLEYQEKVDRVMKRLYLLAAQDIGQQMSGDPDGLSSEMILTYALAGGNDAEPWMVLDVWSSMYSFAIRTAVDNVSDIGRTFAFMFVIVGALVIFSSIHRMVEEDKRQIGTAKAVGMTDKEIATRYLMAGVAPAVAGMLVGTLVGFGIVQMILLLIYGRFYVYGMGYPAFLPGAALVVFVVGMLIATAAAGIACVSLIRRPALSLLNERDEIKTPPRRYGRSRKARHTSKYGFYARMIRRQMRREKWRLLMIAVSITGCMVLLVTGFSIKFAISKSIGRQFTDVEHYDLKVSFDATEAAGGESLQQKIRDVLLSFGLKERDANGGWVEVLERECLYYAEERINGGELLCADPEGLENFFSAEDTENGGHFGQLKTTGVYIPLRASETGNIRIGDNMFLLDSRMDLEVVDVVGIYKHYVGGHLLLTVSSYEEIYKEKPENNCFLIRCGEKTCDPLCEKLSQLPVHVMRTSDKKQEYMKYTTALNAVAALLAAIAAFMAGGVLINLIYLQYYRKKGSLVVMRINGFTAMETAGYVLGESILTHVAGIVLGIIGGTWLSGKILRLMEGRQFHIIRDPQITAWVVAAVILLFFSVIIHMIIVRAVVKLKPTEGVMIR